MQESTIETAVIEWAKEHGISVLKLAGPNDKGKADRLFMKKGVAVFIELKSTGEKPKPLQLRFLEARRRDGFAAGWFDEIPAACHFLRDRLL